jgi:putative ABC transport system permease protein
MRAIPLARRNLFQDRRRAALAVGGTAVAVALVLMLNGIFAGAMRQVTAYLRNLPADLVVSQRGVRTMHMSASALSPSSVDRVGAIDGVAWAEEIRFTTATVRNGASRALSYVIGYSIPDGRGGPRGLVSGDAPERGELVLDEIAADQMGVAIGDPIEALGRSFTLSGLSSGGTSLTNTTAFIANADFAAIRGPAVSYVLVGTRAGADARRVAARIAGQVPGTTVQTRDEIVDQEGRIVRDMSADVMQIMTVIALAIALAVVALTLFTATLAKLREYAVIKALGARQRRLVMTVVGQGLWTTALALIVAVVLTLTIAALVGAATPNVRLTIEPMSVARVGVSVAVVGVLGALVPLRRLARLDPATAFRSA